MSLDQARIPENLATRAVGDNFALIQQNGARTDLQNQLEVVRGDQLGCGKVANLLDEPPPAAWIEVRRGLVKHDHRWLACQHPRQANALSFAEAQVMGRTIRRVRKVDPRETLQREAAGFDSGNSLVERPERYILDDRGAKELVIGILKQEPNPRPTW